MARETGWRISWPNFCPPKDARDVVGGAIQGMKKDQLEIRPGLINMVKLMSRVAPQFILNRLSKQAKAMLAQATAHEEVTR